MAQSIPNILLIEDDKADAMLIQLKIREKWHNAKITQVAYLGDAYRECKQNSYDLILLDLNLPDGYGAQTVYQMRTFEKNTPITVISTFVSDLVERESMKFGAERVMDKAEFLTHCPSATIGGYFNA
ncbi:MAG: response regulator [Micavibrio sp.]|nr:response regulator [Micavibrio sp.]